MPHIHTNDYEHDFTITGYIVRVDGSEPRALFHKHKKYSKLMPVGGHIELNETPWQAVAHELLEESGYTLEQLNVLQPKSRIQNVARVAHHPHPILFNTHSVPGKHFHSDIAFGLVADSDPSQPIAEGESSDLRWLTREQIIALSPDDAYENTRQVYLFIIDTALRDWDQVAATTFSVSAPTE